jgi:uncharacterized membrane protein
MKTKDSLRTTILVALFAALTAIGVLYIHIPVPSATGAFVHLGNAMVLLSVLLLGYWRGALAGGLGFLVSDALAGYLGSPFDEPYYFFECFIVGAAAYLAFVAFKKYPTKIWQVIVIGIATAIAKLIMTELRDTAVNYIMNNKDLGKSLILAAGDLPATFINVVTTVIIVTLVFFPLRNAMQRIFHNQRLSHTDR